MARPYLGAGVAHIILGLIGMLSGAAWIALLYLYVQKELGIDFMTAITERAAWVVFLLASKIWCGFFFFLTGIIAVIVKSRGGLEGLYVGMSVLNTLLWAPVITIINVVILVALVFSTDLLRDGIYAIHELNNQGFGVGLIDQERIVYFFNTTTWLIVFPALGIFVGVAEFIASIVSYSIVCCCRPESISTEYNYEMQAPSKW